MGMYKISATKYRPKTFGEVVGQEAVTSTLENAIKKEKLGQALLFCGPRGVGKTTCARILAKKINFNGVESNDYSFNIFELDAASNRKIEDIRTLNEQVRVPPRVGNFKVYIIDEVHMLTLEAFNAFLKTLEEPPEHVIFILATTEKSKVLPTILSRCQIYDFKRISVLDIKNRLESIVLDQKIKYDDEALFLIAEYSDGSLRDGLQILDRMINFCENEITTKKVSKNLNIIGAKFYIEICDEIIEKRISDVLVKFDTLISNGYRELDFLVGLSNHLRNLFFCKSINTLKLIETSEKLRDLYLNQSKKIDLDWIRKALKIVNSCEINLDKIDNQRIHTEVCLIEVTSLGIIEKNSSPKKKNKDDNKLTGIEEIKNHHYNTENLKNSVPKTNLETVEVEKNEIVKNSSEVNHKNKEVSSFSLASVEKKKTFKERKISKDLPKIKKTENKNDFTQEDLENCWNDYQKIKLKNNEFNLASLLKISTPMKEGNTITYSVISDINKKELADELPKLIGHIRVTLKNDLIDLEVVSNNSVRKEILYTPSEKFKKLVELNPFLDKLRKKLDLDY